MLISEAIQIVRESTLELLQMLENSQLTEEQLAIIGEVIVPRLDGVVTALESQAAAIEAGQPPPRRLGNV